MLILNRHKIAHYRLFEIIKRTRGYPSIESHANTNNQKKNCLIINYRMNSNSLYLGSGHRASSTISSSLSI